MHDRLQAIGYVEVETVAPSILGSPGLRFRGHQFRYSTLEPEPGEIERTYTVRPKWGGEFTEGYRTRQPARFLRSRTLGFESRRRRRPGGIMHAVPRLATA